MTLISAFTTLLKLMREWYLRVVNLRHAFLTRLIRLFTQMLISINKAPRLSHIAYSRRVLVPMYPKPSQQFNPILYKFLIVASLKHGL